MDGAEPSYENYLKYFLNIQHWATEEDLEVFYFSSFDEAWKVGAEGDVGAAVGEPLHPSLLLLAPLDSLRHQHG